MQIISFLNKITLNRATLGSYIIYQYVDDTNLIELIPRNSPSYLPIAATVRNIIDMHRNAKKCKEMTVHFLHVEQLLAKALLKTVLRLELFLAFSDNLPKTSTNKTYDPVSLTPRLSEKRIE